MRSLTIFIHGIGSNKETWSSMISLLKQDIDTKNIIEYKPNITKIDNYSNYYVLYEYASKKFNFSTLLKYIITKATGRINAGDVEINKHTDSFFSYVKARSKEFDKINIVAHSMGGVISMKMLFKIFESSQSNNNYKIFNIMLLGSPLKGSDEPKELKRVLKLNISSNILNELKSDSPTMQSLEQNIENNSNYIKKMFNILFINGDADSRIINIDEKYVEQFGTFESVQGGHSDITSPTSLSDESFVYVKKVFNDENKISLLNINSDKTLNNLSKFLNNVSSLNQKESEDLDRLIQELVDNSQEKGGSTEELLVKDKNKLLLINNGEKFNPLQELKKDGQGGTFTMSYILKNHNLLEFEYQYKNNKNLLTIIKKENVNNCLIKTDSKKLKKRVDNIEDRIQTAIDKGCKEICLDFRSDNYTKMSKHKEILEDLEKHLKENSEITIIILISKDNQMLRVAYKDIFSNIINKYNIEVKVGD